MDQNNNPLNPPAPNLAGFTNNPAPVPPEMPQGSPNPPVANNIPQGLPVQPPPAAAQSTSPGGSKKMMILIIILLIFAVLGIGGYYLYSMQNKSSDSVPKVDTQAELDLAVLEEELGKIDVSEPEDDLTEVDAEISLLEATPSLR